MDCNHILSYHPRINLKSATPVATETFRDSFAPIMEISTTASDISSAFFETPLTSLPTISVNLFVGLKSLIFLAFAICSKATISNPSSFNLLMIDPISFSLSHLTTPSAPREILAKSLLLRPKRSVGVGVVPINTIFETPRQSAVRKIEPVFSTLRKLSNINTQSFMSLTRMVSWTRQASSTELATNHPK